MIFSEERTFPPHILQLRAIFKVNAMTGSSLHALLLLSDSALPLGSFAFSSGLESFLAHNRHTGNAARLEAFNKFLSGSLENLASTALPYALTAYSWPTTLTQLDNDLDASTQFTVALRASVTKVRDLLTIWERALAESAQGDDAAGQAMRDFTSAMKASEPDDGSGLRLNAHFAPLFGAACRALDVTLDDTAYLLLLNHAKAVLSAAVRASVLGPYQSQTILASARLQGLIKDLIARYRHTRTEEAAVTVPVMDLWMGRHELLYSRIFNS